MLDRGDPERAEQRFLRPVRALLEVADLVGDDPRQDHRRAARVVPHRVRFGLELPVGGEVGTVGGTGAEQHLDHVARAGVLLDPLEPGAHVQHLVDGDGVAGIGGVVPLGYRRRSEHVDAPLGDEDAEHRLGDRLRHRPRAVRVVRIPPVAVALEHQLTALHGENCVDAAALPLRRRQLRREVLVEGGGVDRRRQLGDGPLVGRPRDAVGLRRVAGAVEHPPEPGGIEGLEPLRWDLERRTVRGGRVRRGRGSRGSHGECQHDRKLVTAQAHTEPVSRPGRATRRSRDTGRCGRDGGVYTPTDGHHHGGGGGRPRRSASGGNRPRAWRGAVPVHPRTPSAQLSRARRRPRGQRALHRRGTRSQRRRHADHRRQTERPGSNASGTRRDRASWPQRPHRRGVRGDELHVVPARRAPSPARCRRPGRASVRLRLHRRRAHLGR